MELLGIFIQFADFIFNRIILGLQIGEILVSIALLTLAFNSLNAFKKDN